MSSLPSFLNGGGDAARMIRERDWSNHPLGAPETWAAELKTALSMVLNSPESMILAWGRELSFFFNDTYFPLLGPRLSWAMGERFDKVWADAWEQAKPIIDEAFAGRAKRFIDLPWKLDTDRGAAETWWTFSYSRVLDADGQVAGLLIVTNETTSRVLSDRKAKVAEEQLLRAQEAGGVGLFTIDIADDSVIATPEFCRIYGVPHCERVPLMAIESLVLPEDASHASTLSQRRAGRMGQTEYRIRRPDDGAIRWVSRRADVEHDGEGRPIRYAGVVRDVTAEHEATEALREAEHALRSSEARFRTLTQALPNQVWTATPDGALDWVNERTREYSGSSDVTFGGRGWTAIVHPDDLANAARRWAAALSSGDVYEVEFRIRRADDVYRWHLVRAVAETNSEGVIVRWIGTNTDIDDQKRAELELAAAKTSAEDANRAKSDFLANMSHELRTPLSAIIGYSEMMLEEVGEGVEGKALAPDLRKVEANARHLLGLINDVLDLSKVESGKMDVYAETFDVGAMLQELGTTVGSLINRKHNRLELRLDPRLGTAHTDLTKVRQILLNLLSNAAKFTENGIITLDASRATGADGIERLTFHVRDTGIGMTAEQLARLFQRFSQAENSTSRRFGGTGLGLSLVKAFCDMLGGTVSVHSASGEGTVFTARIPTSFEQLDEEGAAPELDASPVDVPGAADLVLVIDDDADQRALMIRFLHREGFHAQVAADGQTGLALARRLHPRAILLDAMMPGIDGWSVLSALKGDPALADIPVVMVTFVEQRALAASLGAADYVLKPVKWDRFKAVMDRYRPRENEVLIIDDDEDARGRMRTMLERDGWSVTEAEHGQAGLERLSEHLPGVVLLDLTMPVMDGFTFLEAMRARPLCATIPVVVLTAMDLSRADRRRLYGVSQVLNKGDVSLQTLGNRLHEAAERQPSAA